MATRNDYGTLNSKKSKQQQKVEMGRFKLIYNTTKGASPAKKSDKYKTKK